MDHLALTPELILQAYANGVFPMAEGRDDHEIFWVDPRERGIIPLDGFHISHSLAKVIRSDRFRVTFNQDFEGVMEGCADRDETWINDTIFELYGALHAMGFGHSLEIWQGEQLVGGTYGLTLGTAFFGESMFSRAPNASKVALAYMVARLKRTGFTLFDTQFLTPHLASLGGIEIPRAQYRDMLRNALQARADITALARDLTPQEVVQDSGQRS
ncbi:MAG: leucyl/phenylalanyl-tRNA--protein transferase [Alphaproteobacteria bacterium]|nr:leucyl/phenylalanyl-tRNA--protein transferase [Alphaproteobacteria bacterium]MBU1278785.1 leucyl/phenylalanyl-tRNA--protein transferase [Alphaproteobacteria bacterium]MBU1574357.1 leucyl/phenylalanyl-tRNA--protein transferase [Alphaproteobacteria bacterium]MBU1828053.1 leucyl/phenylalanyl-tRNA--protein transferase [Alphaproteobacteria bacterium]MBU2077519.1 leucyl/phenylalanyl-tRNA--protein transferase [Alphaproteobacteria bacterium]